MDLVLIEISESQNPVDHQLQAAIYLNEKKNLFD